MYLIAADVSEFVASRDLKRLADLGLIVPHGEKRGRYYTGSPELKQIRQRTRDPSPMPDPYQIVKKTTQAKDDSGPLLPGL
jgi:hypothetical protein